MSPEINFSALRLCAAGSNWGSSFYVREGHAQPVSGFDISAAREAAKSFSLAVEDSFTAAKHNPRLTVGGHLQQQWGQVLPKACMLLRTVCCSL